MINVLEYLEETVTRVPDKVAFTGGNTGGNTSGNEAAEALTFRGLYDAARGMGSYLAARGIYKQPVVIFMEKSPSMIAAFLGAVYGGCFYVPLDGEIPAFRIKLILETVKPPLIICDEATHKLLEEWGTINSTGPGEEAPQTEFYQKISTHTIDENALAGIRARAIDTDPLYVVFTSGSTGTPKGVIASHRSVIDYIENLSAVLGVSGDTVFGNQSPLYLDACLKEIFPTLKFGAAAFLIPKPLFMFPVKLIEYLNEKKINTICWVASALGLVAGLGALEKAAPATLHTVAFGSEVFPVKHFNRWREALPEARFIHLYGPTEATGMSAYYEADTAFAEDGAIPIGRPFTNTGIILLDDNGKTPPDGEPGEICIRGAGLSLGYFADEEKTRAAFVQNPLSVVPDRIYKTGDLGYRKDGLLYFISRRDHQIKHMGHRIELAEIEYVANRCDEVELACVVFDAAAGKIIMYYAGAADSKAAVSAELKKNLPRYMVPHGVFPLDALPLTPGGKIDRAGLLEKYYLVRRNAK